MLKLDRKNTALLIIDVQVDFCSKDGASAKYGGKLTHMEKMLPRLEKFHEKMNKHGIAAYLTRYVTKKNGAPENLQLLLRSSKLFPICAEGTTGADIYQLHPYPQDTIIDKEYYDAFAGTTLLQDLKNKSIQNVFIAGVWTDICVETTAKRALAEGFNVFVLEDLVSTIDERMDRHVAVLEDFDRFFGFVKSSDEALELLDSNYFSI